MQIDRKYKRGIKILIEIMYSGLQLTEGAFLGKAAIIVPFVMRVPDMRIEIESIRPAAAR